MNLFDNRSADPMLIARQMEAFDDPGWIYELKMDGFRCLSYLDQETVDLRNKRNMQVLQKFPELADIWKNVQGKCILDGEIVVLTDGVPDFYRLQKRTLLTDRFKIQLEAKRYPASFVVFDCIYLDGKELIREPLLRRKEFLQKIVREDAGIAVSRYIEEKGTALFQAADERKLEGVVAKKKDSIYLMGKRTKDWVKFKRMADEEFVVAGYVVNGRHTFSLVIAKYKGDALVYKGHVTAGVTKEVIDALTISGRNPFRTVPAGNEDTVWVLPEQVCIVEYMPNTKDVLRQPVFKGFRDDVCAEKVRE